jgi:hypothetical protein
MGDFSHRYPSCENAKQARCRCGQCGGSMHNVGGYILMAREAPETRRDHHNTLERELIRGPDSILPRASANNRRIVAKICAVEIADEIAAYAPVSPPPLNGEPGHQSASEDQQTSPGPDVDQVEAVANLLTRDLWPEIQKAIDEAAAESGLDPGTVRRELATHGWCDLLVGIIQVIEEARGVLDGVKDTARVTIVKAITGSSKQSLRHHVTDHIVGLMVDKVWSTLFAAITHSVPPLALLDNDEFLRTLRILAAFICPAPEQHSEVREHALKPLGEDAKGYLSDQTKEYLAEVFAEWRAAPGTRDHDPGSQAA